MVNKGILKALSSVLWMNEARLLAVALEGIDNVLKNGKEHFTQNGENQFALVFEQEGGIDRLESLQVHPNIQIYERVIKMLETYFQEENDALMLENAVSGVGPADDGTTFNF